MMNILAQPTISLEILHQLPINCRAQTVTTLKENMFILCSQEDQQGIKVYDRNSMTEVTNIWLPATHLRDMFSCCISNCVYVLCIDLAWEHYSILRITKDGEHQFNVSPWICDPELPGCSLSVSVNFNLIAHSMRKGHTHWALSGYNTHGHLLNKIRLAKVDPFGGFLCFDRVIQKSNGNLILTYVNDDWQIELAEIDADGSVERRYKSSLTVGSGVNFADMSGRIVIANRHNGVELLDSEFNLLEVTGSYMYLNVGQNVLYKLHYNSERNEVVGTCDNSPMNSVITIFRFKEERNRSKLC